MSVKARVAKLEHKAGVGQLCLDCKRHLIRYSDLIRRTPRDGVLATPCDGCGFPRHMILYGHTEREQELLRELSRPRGRTLEERRRRFTVSVYLMMTPRQREIEAVGDAEEKRLRDIQPPPSDVRTQIKVLDEYAAVAASRQAGRRLLISVEKDEEHYSRRAPLRHAMAVVEEARAEARKADDEELYRLLVMLKLEPYDQLSPARTPEKTVRFRTDPTAPVPRNPMVFDPTAAHVPDPADQSKMMVLGRSIGPDTYDPNHPDAVQFQRSPPPDPTAGLTVESVEAERERSRKSRLYYRPDDYDGDRRY